MTCECEPASREILLLSGDYPTTRAAELDDLLRQAAGRASELKLMVDLAQVDRLAAACIGVLVAHRDHIELSQVPPRVRRQLDVTRVNQVLRDAAP